MANPLRKTLEYLGLVEETAVSETATPQSVQPVPSAASQANQPKASVTHIRRSGAKNADHMNEIVTVHPKRYADVQSIAESFRDGIPVIINLSQMTESDARRLVDFSSGLAQGLYGKIERVTPKVFLLSPVHVLVSTEEGSQEEKEKTDTGFFS